MKILFNIRIPSELKTKLRKASELDNRTMSGYVIEVLTKATHLTLLKAKKEKQAYERGH